MDTIFEVSLGRLLVPVVIAVILATVVLSITAFRRPYLLRVGLRNLPRRRLRTVLVVLGLMLATMFVSTAVAVDETIVLAVENVAVFNLGRLDEDVVGGTGSLGLFDQSVASTIATHLASDHAVAGVAPALAIPDVLVTDATQNQVRGSVVALGVGGSAAGPLTDFQVAGANGVTDSPVDLAPGQVFLNSTLAQLLHAKAGDQLSLYSATWNGTKFTATVRAVVSGGALGDRPSLVVQLGSLQQLAGSPGLINHVYVANVGDGVTGVQYSDSIAHEIHAVLRSGERVSKVKQEGIRYALSAQDTFGRILLLFAFFSFTIGLLLIFLIFALLAAERRAELGVARALGVRRGQVVMMLLFEGAGYDLLGAAIGTAAGLGLCAAIVSAVQPTVAKLGFPLKLSIDPASMVTAFGLGLLFTLAMIIVSAWAVSRVSIAAALRDLPEPPRPRFSLWHALQSTLRALLHLREMPEVAVREVGAFGWALTTRGIIPMVLGVLMTRLAELQYNVFALAIGLSLVWAGVVLLVRAVALALVVRRARKQPAARALRRIARAEAASDRLASLAIGGAMTLYWALPLDVARWFGLTRFAGNLEVLFVAGVMMVFGAALALTSNLDVVLRPFLWLIARMRGWQHLVPIANAYPTSRPGRTGANVALFSLICFTLVVMACITSSTISDQSTVPATAVGYDIVGQALFTDAGTPAQVQSALRQANRGTAGQITAVSSGRPIPLGVIEPGATNARWSVYPAAEVDGAFLSGTGLPLIARASGYSSDQAVWQAVRTRPGNVVIDIGALSQQDAATLGVGLPSMATAAEFVGPPILSALPGASSFVAQSGANLGPQQRLGVLSEFAKIASDPRQLAKYTLQLQGIASAPGTINDTPLWIGDLRGGAVTEVHVVGLVSDPYGLHHDLYGSAATFAPVEHGLQPFGTQYYYFQVAPGTDPHTAAFAIGSALVSRGFETTVVSDILGDINGPRLLISRLLIGLVGITLFVGLAALVVTGSRAVVERRQEIGVLRALGFRRGQIALLFLFEAAVVGVVGSLLGVGLGLDLCRNAFAAGFFDQFQSHLELVVPQLELAGIAGAALLVSLIAALLPAWQSSRVTPAEALRYQ